ncbi:MAG: hypothetical protein IPP35_06020 [Elusimicrobia bacterium]|nr:hypothetical protein [Elusimicrobiota bacterium]
MKKLLAVVLVLGSMAVFVGTVKAAATADLTITVTPVGNKSVALSQASLNLGNLNLAAVDQLSSSVTVTNDGNIVEAFGLRIKTADGTWSSGAAAGANTYNLRALFDDSAVPPLAGAFLANDDLLTQVAPVVATGVGECIRGPGRVGGGGVGDEGTVV